MTVGDVLQLAAVLIASALTLYGVIRRLNRVEVRQQDHLEIQAAKDGERQAEQELEACRDQNLELRNKNAELTAELAETKRDAAYFEMRMNYWKRQVEGERP